jgi:iron complex outermembrane recepter protein
MYALRTYLEEDDKTIETLLEQPTYFKARGNSQTLRTGVDYALSANTDLGVVLSGTLLNRNGTGSGQAIWRNASGGTDSLIDTHSKNETDWKNGAVNLNFRHKFSAQQELTADLDWVGYDIQGNQAFQNERKGNAGYTESYTGELPSTIRILSFKADHTVNLGKSFTLESGIKLAATKTDNDAAYFLDQGTGSEPDLSKTNHFLYDENIRAAYASVAKKSGPWSMQLGLRYEYTGYTGRQLGNSVVKDSAFSNNYGSLFPNFLGSLKLDSNNELSLTIGRRIDRPPYQKLNPFVSILNKYTYQVGNPLMKPQYTQNIELSHQYKDFLSTSLSYSLTTDYFSQIFYSDTAGTVYYTEGNLGKRQIFGLSVGFNKALLPAWTLNTQVDLQHKKMAGFVWKEMEAAITQMSFSLSNQVRFSKVWMAELSGYYITRSQADIQEVVEPTGQVSLGLSRQVLRNKGSLKFSYRDIFYTQDMEGFTLFNHATEYFRLQRDTRVATLAFTYRFGKGLKPMTKKRSAVDEMERVNN